jgi:hypothetical protein
MPRAGLFSPDRGNAGRMKTSFHLERDIRTFSEKNATGMCAPAVKCPCFLSRPQPFDARQDERRVQRGFMARA